jgi:hypothetical protein
LGGGGKRIPIIFNLGEEIVGVRKPSPDPLLSSYRIHHHLDVRASKARVRLNQVS